MCDVKDENEEASAVVRDQSKKNTGSPFFGGGSFRVSTSMLSQATPKGS